MYSHPFDVSPSQFKKPLAHRIPHTPPLQVADAFGDVGHTVPHVPQFSGLTVVLISQPLARSRSQSLKPGPQTSVHIPAVHTGVALVPPVQIVPQPPQLFRSLPMFVSHPFSDDESQSANPALHTVPHVADAQIADALVAPGQVVVHVPQCVALVARFTSQPFARLPSQSA
jgi:hypothetical protein